MCRDSATITISTREIHIRPAFVPLAFLSLVYPTRLGNCSCIAIHDRRRFINTDGSIAPCPPPSEFFSAIPPLQRERGGLLRARNYRDFRHTLYVRETRGSCPLSPFPFASLGVSPSPSPRLARPACKSEQDRARRSRWMV